MTRLFDVMDIFYKSTRFKITTAHYIYQFLKLLRFKSERIIRRSGINYAVDISEGIDLSIFLFGSFQKHVICSRYVSLPADAVVVDVGANIGSVSLSIAKSLAQSKIYAFEPTDYAYAKLLKNIELNEQLKARIVPLQFFISSDDDQQVTRKIFSSWRVDTLDGERHPVHLGIAKDASVPQISLDHFVEEKQINRLDFIKIDTDGNELKVLFGAVNSLRKFKPAVVFELSTYLLRENNQSFGEFEQFFHGLGYALVDLLSGKTVCEANLDAIVPKSGSVDILAIPRHDDAGA